MNWNAAVEFLGVLTLAAMAAGVFVGIASALVPLVGVGWAVAAMVALIFLSGAAVVGYIER